MRKSYLENPNGKTHASNGHIFKVRGGYNAVVIIGNYRDIKFFAAIPATQNGYQKAKNKARSYIRTNFNCVAYSS